MSPLCDITKGVFPEQFALAQWNKIHSKCLFHISGNHLVSNTVVIRHR